MSAVCLRTSSVVGTVLWLFACARAAGPEPQDPQTTPAPVPPVATKSGASKTTTAIASAPNSTNAVADPPEQPRKPNVVPVLPMNPAGVVDFEQFLNRFVELYNAREFKQLDSVLVASSPIMLIDNWGGLNIQPTFHKSFSSLIATIDDQVRWAHSPLGEGVWTVGHLRRAGCVDQKPNPPQFLFGPVTNDSLLVESSIGPVSFDVPGDSEKATLMSKDITEFAFDDVEGVQLYFQRRSNGWRLVAVDLVAPAC